MREWIRQHPWRLEAIPFAFVVSAVAGPFINPQQVPGTTSGQTSDWYINYGVRAAVVLSWWLLMLMINHYWVRLENEKIYNVFAPAGTTIVATIGSPNFFMLIKGSEVFSNVDLLWTGVWMLVVFAAIAVEASIEHSRTAGHWAIMRSIPRPPAFVEQIVPGEAFYYRDTVRRWWQILSFSLVVVMALSGSFWLLHPNIWLSVAGGLTAAIFLLINCEAVFVVTNQQVVARIGRRRLNLPMHTIQSCTIHNYTVTDAGGDLRKPIFNTDTSLRQHNYIAPFTTDNCVRVKTVNGHDYMIGFRDPETACNLIHSALDARGTTEELE